VSSPTPTGRRSAPAVGAAPTGAASTAAHRPARPRGRRPRSAASGRRPHRPGRPLPGPRVPGTGSSGPGRRGGERSGRSHGRVRHRDQDRGARPLTGAAPLPRTPSTKARTSTGSSSPNGAGSSVAACRSSSRTTSSTRPTPCRSAGAGGAGQGLHALRGHRFRPDHGLRPLRDSVGVPYLSAGSTRRPDRVEELLRRLATYAQQNRTIVGLVKNVMHKTKIASSSAHQPASTTRCYRIDGRSAPAPGPAS